MKDIRKQCRTQLELERVLLLNKMDIWTASGVHSNADPINQQLWQQTQAKLTRINQAQTRLVNGQFGLCQKCQRPIDPERLEAISYAEHCVSCQREIERSTLHRVH